MLILSPSIHAKKHTPPYKCTIPECESSFRSAADRDRHVDGIHLRAAENVKVAFCPHSGCKHSAARGKGMTRKDAMNVHIRNQHGGVGQLGWGIRRPDG